MREDVFPTSILAKVAEKDLDSVFLHWKRKAAPLRDLSASEVDAVLRKEQRHFEAMSKSTCKKIKGQLRDALVELAPDTAEATAVSIEPNASNKLRLAWTQLIQQELDKLESKRVAKAAQTFEPTSFVGSFIKSRSVTPATPIARSHPRGVSPSDDEAEYEVLSSTSDEEGSTTEDDPELEKPSAEVAAASKPEAKLHKPLLLADHKAELNAMKQAKSPAKLQPRSVNWITDTFVDGAQFVAKIVSGDNPWPTWSRSELKVVCANVSRLFDMVDFREKAGEELAKKARDALLKRESKLFVSIRMHLFEIRLGEKGVERFHSNVQDEAARHDFVSTYKKPKAFKLYLKELNEVTKSTEAKKTKSSASYATPAKPVTAARGVRRRYQHRRTCCFIRTFLWR